MSKSDSSRLSIGSILLRTVLTLAATLVAAVGGWALLSRLTRSAQTINSAESSAQEAPEAGRAPSVEDSIDKLSDAEKQRLLDELGKQL